MMVAIFAIAIVATAFLAYFLGTAVAYHTFYRQARSGRLAFGNDVFWCELQPSSPFAEER